MANFTAANSNGSHFAEQLAGGEDNLDIFAVFGLPADGPQLDIRALESHFKRIPEVARLAYVLTMEAMC